MNGTITPYGRGQILSAYFNPDQWVAPAGLWVAYTRDAPLTNTDGSQLDEPPGGYLRAAIGVLSSLNWGFTGFAEFYNLNTITFAAATADWGLITGWAVCDSANPGTGHVIMAGSMIEPQQVLSGDAPAIDPAGIAAGLYD